MDEKSILKYLLLVGSLRKRFDEKITEWHSDNLEILHKFKREFPELHLWILKTDTLIDIIYNLQVTQVEDGECYFYMENDNFDFAIHAIRSTEDYPRGELDGTLMGKGDEPGSNDLRDGPYSKETWDRIIKQIANIVSYTNNR